MNPNLKMLHVFFTPACKERDLEMVPSRAVKMIPIIEMRLRRSDLKRLLKLCGSTSLGFTYSKGVCHKECWNSLNSYN